MKEALKVIQNNFESSSGKTPEYLAAHKLFDKEFTELLTKLGCYAILMHKPNHFDISGFFTSPDYKIWYISISDLRWSKDQMLIREAKSYTDFTGGANGYINLKQTALNFEIDLKFKLRIH